MAKYVRNRLKVQREITHQLEYEPSEPIIIRLEGWNIFQAGEIHTGKMNIYEMNGDIWINGYMIYGWIDYNYHCNKCSHTLIYDAIHNSQFCPECNTWIYSECGCSCCSTRELKPLPTLGLDEDTYQMRYLESFY